MFRILFFLENVFNFTCNCTGDEHIHIYFWIVFSSFQLIVQFLRSFANKFCFMNRLEDSI